MSRIEHIFTEQDRLIEVLSHSILKQVQNAIDTKGKASLLVSGEDMYKMPIHSVLNQDIKDIEVDNK